MLPALRDDRSRAAHRCSDDVDPHEGLVDGCQHIPPRRGWLPIDAETIILPEAIVESFTTSAHEILKPTFDLIWNACGFPGSENFDAEGNWVTRRR